MTIPKALLTIFGAALLGTACGGAMGYLIGRYLPTAYVSIFRLGPQADPAEVGLGLGLPQGFIGGVLIGMVVVVVVAWHDVRCREIASRKEG